MSNVKYVISEGNSEVVINKSRFLGLIKKVTTEEEAIEYEIRQTQLNDFDCRGA